MEEHNENFYSLEELKRERDCYEGYKDGEEVFYFVGALRYACDEIERLNKENKELNKICARKSHYIDKKDLEIGRLNNIINEIRNAFEDKNIHNNMELVRKIKNKLKGVNKE